MVYTCLTAAFDDALTAHILTAAILTRTTNPVRSSTKPEARKNTTSYSYCPLRFPLQPQLPLLPIPPLPPIPLRLPLRVLEY